MQAQEEKQLEAIKNLRSEININDFGLPAGIYRIDLLPFHDYAPQTFSPIKTLTSPDHETDVEASHDPDAHMISETSGISTVDVDVSVPQISHRIAGFDAEALRSAYMPLEYHEGYPTFSNGDPFWLQLIYEHNDAYVAFHRYLQMSSTTPADSLRAPNPTSPKEYAGATGFRSIALLAAQLYGHDCDLLAAQERLKIWSELFYWEWRAKSYDHFRVARHRHQQEIRAIETQDTHYGMARRLGAKLMEYVDSEDFTDMMTPKIALDGLKLVTSLERISAGLPAAGPNKEDGGAPVPTFEMTMRRIGQSSKNDDEIQLDEGSVLLQRSFDSPEELQFMQEMILKIHAPIPTSRR